MIKTIPHLGRKIFFCCSISITTLLAISNLAPFLNPANWWIISILGLIFPGLLILTLSFFILWLFIKPKNSIFPLAIIFISIPSLHNSIAINYKSQFNNKKVTGSIRVITWNVGLMNFTTLDASTAIKKNESMLNKLKEFNADVLCLQEFFTSVTPGILNNFTDSISKTLGYPYHYFSRDNPFFSGQFYSGSIIFSKFKIIDSNRFAYPNAMSGALIKTKLLVNTDTIELFTTHLQSVHFNKYEYQIINNIKYGSNFTLKGFATIIRKLKYGYRERTKQIKTITTLLYKEKGPVIFAGDLNDVPTGYAYRTIKKNMKDVWLINGSGIGRTFRYIFPTLRIDYIFINRYFKPLQTQRIISLGSDHYGLVTDLILKKEVE